MIATLQRESAAGLKLYLEYLIFQRNDSVSDWRRVLLNVANDSPPGTLTALCQ